jgi:GDP-D-mannose 3',5'-epimerase
VKSVVTGGTGFIGSNLTKRLVEAGRDVIVTCHRASNDGDSLIELGIDVERRSVDLTDYSDAETAVDGADTVFHLAAMVGNSTYLHASQTTEVTSLQTNLMIDANVFRACIMSGVSKIIFASSCAVYPVDRQMMTGAIFREDEVRPGSSFTPEVQLGMINPDGGYGWAKLVGEIQLNWTKGMDIGIARIFNIYGENETLGEKTHVIGDLMNRLRFSSDGDFAVYGDGQQTRDFLHVSDCVDALVTLEEKAGSPPFTVNIGSGNAVSIGDIARKIVSISGRNLNLVFDTTRPVGVISRTADISLARALLGWEPKISLDDGLKRTFEWIRQKHGDSQVQALHGEL